MNLTEALHDILTTDPRGCEHPTPFQPQCERIAKRLAHRIRPPEPDRTDSSFAQEQRDRLPHTFPLCRCGEDHGSEAWSRGWDSRGEADAAKSEPDR